jgi:hypothetical protein
MSLVRKSAGVELIDLLDRILDKGIVVDASSRLHFIGANLIKRRMLVAIASIDIHLKHSEARVVAKLAGRRPFASEEYPKKNAENRSLTKSRGA